MPNTRKILLCATQRSGSTIVVEDLRNTGLLGVPAEYFIPWNPGQRKTDYDRRLEIMHAKGSSENGVFAAKIMANQLLKVNRCLANSLNGTTDPGADGRYFSHFHDRFKGVSFVWIRRRQTIRQAISRVMALQTGVNHAIEGKDDRHFAGNILKGYKDTYNQYAQYNFRKIRNQIMRIQHENLIWQRYFQDWGINPIIIDYEDYVVNWEKYIHQIAASVDVTLSAELQERKLVKLSNQLNEEWFSNYTAEIIETIKP